MSLASRGHLAGQAAAGEEEIAEMTGLNEAE